MMKSVLGMAVALAFSSVAHAADQGQGKVNFKGTVIDAPCGIAPESADQSIDFGQISKAHLEANGISVKKDLDIKLVNCTFDQDKLKTVKVAFSGTTVTGQPKELGTAGDTGTAIVVSSSDGSLVTFDGAQSSGTTKLKAGDNTLHYNSWVKKATNGTLKEGEFTAVTNFNLIYE
ncbi:MULTISPECIES: fimbrial protein [Cronobacter]|uniref:fimbrial protein n=1 Tax=Cronobacter TaxID=413496 RepID=UPI000BEA7D22|nr:MULTISPECIES: fimbrial protein [Cronobacter]EJV9475479.1 type 1 fimbrial protein [Cronobacter sakazakii]ELY4340366.1 type 1 fimbrial protein [Cronobacter sakazakii]NCH44601.1 type 1 fimbrial protein [Cronobacter sakazakii]NCH53587.1 type 1 fimbrial protein [Cronobacter muytjensii]PQV83389.1 type 1 fimbrial protein [Cronobacter sakazakii]